MSRNRNGTASLMDRFAELLANTAGTENDGKVPFVGRQLGLTTAEANGVMQNLRKRLGAQAR